MATATLTVQRNALTPTTGVQTCTAGDTLTVRFQAPGGLRAPRVEIWGYPPSFVTPAGWTLDATNRVIYYAGADALPPAVTAPAGPAKLFFRGLAANADPDDVSAIEVLSANGLHATPAGETSQFGGAAEGAAKHVDENFRSIDANLGGGVGVFGDGSDGDVTISTTVTLTRETYYNNLTITSTGRLIPNAHAVYVKGTLTIDAGGRLDADGAAGATGTSGGAQATGGQGANKAGGAGYLGVGANGGNGGTNGGNGVVGAVSNNSGGGAGGAGGLGGTGSTQLGGTVSTPSAQGTGLRAAGRGWPGLFVYSLSFFAVQGGGGGGGGGGSSTLGGGSGGGGAGGGGGGVLVVVARNVVNAGTISARGGAGGAGFPNSLGTTAGGGGGGGGGWLRLEYRTLTNTGTISAAGGAGGAAGAISGTAVAGTAGTAGAAGTALLLSL